MSITKFLGENVTAIKNFAEYLEPSELDNLDDLQPGEGGIIRDGMKKIAACRDRDGQLHLNSAACTHLGCYVHWNSTEQCWDCPCHGSQFAPDGTVLNGPAIASLERVNRDTKPNDAYPRLWRARKAMQRVDLIQDERVHPRGLRCSWSWELRNQVRR